MAGRQQKTTGKTTKASSGRKTTAKGKKVSEKKAGVTPEEAQQQAGIRDEVVVLVILAVSILLVLSNFNLCGKMGQAISGVTFGLFGIMAYVFPLVVFFGISFFVANRSNRIAKIKLISSIFCYIFLTILVHMVTEPYDAGAKLIDAYRNSSAGKNGGGLIGGAVVKVLHPLLGTVGCYVVIIVLILISVVLITQKSIFIPLGKKGRRAYSKASERHKEQRELRRKEKEAQREAEAAEEVRGTGGNRNVTFEDVKEKFENKDFNFDLSAATEVPEKETVKK